MKKIIVLLLSTILLLSFSACQKAAKPSAAPDKSAITQNATKYFEQMRSGDFSTIYSALPDGVKKQTQSAQAIQTAWDEAVEIAGDLPKDGKPKVSCYRPENTDQIRVEFIIPCKAGEFKVFINYDSNGSLYNYVIWKNN